MLALIMWELIDGKANMNDTANKQIECLVLGIGNILWADEGFGVRAAERLNELYAIQTPGVFVEDGGTLGMYLLEPICQTRRLLILDCCDFHGAPAELKVLRNGDVKAWSSTKISPHQTGMNDILASAMLLGHEPEEIAVVGVQPKLLDDYGGSLSEEVKARLDEAVEMARGILEQWGYALRRRNEGEAVPELSPASCLSIETYEATRPDETVAYRHGDERFLAKVLKKD